MCSNLHWASSKFWNGIQKLDCSFLMKLAMKSASKKPEYQKIWWLAWDSKKKIETEIHEHASKHNHFLYPPFRSWSFTRQNRYSEKGKNPLGREKSSEHREFSQMMTSEIWEGQSPRPRSLIIYSALLCPLVKLRARAGARAWSPVQFQPCNVIIS